MPYQLRIRKEAEDDLHGAYKYYEQGRQGLGQDFLLCVEESLSKIVRNPQHYPVIHKNIHRTLVKRFPFGIFFIVKNKTIVILAVIHGSRNPKKWKTRM